MLVPSGETWNVEDEGHFSVASLLPAAQRHCGGWGVGYLRQLGVPREGSRPPGNLHHAPGRLPARVCFPVALKDH